MIIRTKLLDFIESNWDIVGEQNGDVRVSVTVMFVIWLQTFDIYFWRLTFDVWLSTFDSWIFNPDFWLLTLTFDCQLSTFDVRRLRSTFDVLTLDFWLFFLDKLTVYLMYRARLVATPCSIGLASSRPARRRCTFQIPNFDFWLWFQLWTFDFWYVLNYDYWLLGFDCWLLTFDFRYSFFDVQHSTLDFWLCPWLDFIFLNLN